MVNTINGSFEGGGFKERSKTIHHRSSKTNESIMRSNSHYRLSPGSQKSADMDDDGFP